MPTGPSHRVTTDIMFDANGVERARGSAPCHCMIGADHDAAEMMLTDFPGDDDDDSGERLGAADAEAIYLSSGQDEDYDFR